MSKSKYRKELFDRSIPGFTELLDWPKEPGYPEEISRISLYRDGPVVVSIKSTTGDDIDFFFEPTLGRLCYGRGHRKADAAFIRKGTIFEKEVYSYFEIARRKLSIRNFSVIEIELFNDCFNTAKVHSGC